MRGAAAARVRRAAAPRAPGRATSATGAYHCLINTGVIRIWGATEVNAPRIISKRQVQCRRRRAEVTPAKSPTAGLQKPTSAASARLESAPPELSFPNQVPWRELLGGATEVSGRPGKLSAQNKKFRAGPRSTSGVTKVYDHSGRNINRGTPRGRTSGRRGQATQPERPNPAGGQGKPER